MGNEHYAGCIDFVGTMDGDPVIIDFKTQGTKEKRKINFYPEWVEQLAAYNQFADEETKCLNIVFSTTEAGRHELKEWTQKEVDNGWDTFYDCLRIFYRKRLQLPLED